MHNSVSILQSLNIGQFAYRPIPVLGLFSMLFFLLLSFLHVFGKIDCLNDSE